MTNQITHDWQYEFSHETINFPRTVFLPNYETWNSSYLSDWLISGMSFITVLLIQYQRTIMLLSYTNPFSSEHYHSYANDSTPHASNCHLLLLSWITISWCCLFVYGMILKRSLTAELETSSTHRKLYQAHCPTNELRARLYCGYEWHFPRK